MCASIFIYLFYLFKVHMYIYSATWRTQKEGYGNPYQFVPFK